MIPTIVVHGGSGTVAQEHHDAVVAAARAAAEAGRQRLRTGDGAEQAVVAAVRVLEQAEATNAARGACMTADGEFELDAGIMRSEGPRGPAAHGAVAAVPNLANPIDLARAVMLRGPHRLLVAQGAVAFGRADGVARFDRDALWTAKAQARFDAAVSGRSDVYGQADTVGAVAIDEHGTLCAGGSTGGVLLKASGRVGDCPLIGAGFYASSSLGAACATGVGEAIMTQVAAVRALERARQIDPDHAAEQICALVATERAGDGPATCGLILITPSGDVGIAHRSPHMSWACARGDEPVQAALRRGSLAPATDQRL